MLVIFQLILIIVISISMSCRMGDITLGERFECEVMSFEELAEVIQLQRCDNGLNTCICSDYCSKTYASIALLQFSLLLIHP